MNYYSPILGNGAYDFGEILFLKYNFDLAPVRNIFISPLSMIG